MNRLIQSINTKSSPSPSTSGHRDRDSMLFPTLEADAKVENSSTESVARKSWKFFTSRKGKTTDKKENLTIGTPKSRRRHSIANDLESLAALRHPKESPSTLDNTSTTDQDTVTVPSGHAPLRSTEQGKTTKDGKKVPSRRSRRRASTQSSQTSCTETVDPMNAEKSKAKDAEDVTGDEHENEQVSAQYEVAKASQMKRQRRSSIHTSTPLSPKRPTTSSPRSRRRASVGHERVYYTPTRVPSYLLHPEGPSKALLEGTEKQTKNLRLLELSELLVGLDVSARPRQPMDTPNNKQDMKKCGRQHSRGKKQQHTPSEQIDLSSEAEASASSPEPSPEEILKAGLHLRPNCIDGNKEQTHHTIDIHCDFERSSPQRKKSFEGHLHPPPSLVDLSTSISYDSDNSATLRAGAQITDGKLCLTAPLSPTRTRRGGRRPTLTEKPNEDDESNDGQEEFSGSDEKPSRRKKKKKGLKPPGETSTEEEGDEGKKRRRKKKSKKKSRRSSRAKKSSLKPPGETSSEEEEECTKEKSKRKSGRSSRSKKTFLRLPGDTSSEDEDEMENEDLRASLLSYPKTFRRHTLIYSLPKKAKDIVRTISRKRSVRPTMKFLKILPHMLPTVKGLLAPTRVHPTDSELSTSTIPTSNLSGSAPTETEATRLRESGKSRPKSSWVPPKPTPPPALTSCNGESHMSTIAEQPEWVDPNLKCTSLETSSELAKPITFPVKEENITPSFSREALKTTEYGETIQNGGEIRSRRARRRQDLQKRFERNTLKMTETLDGVNNAVND